MKSIRSRILTTAATLLALLCPVARAEAPAKTSETKFLRFVEDRAGNARLEVAETAYQNKDGVSVRLIGAVHIADAEFFHGLGESFVHYDALLYEMVKPKDAEAVKRAQKSGAGGGWIGGTQRFMKNRLGLTFQLDEVDYDKPNFVHADLDWETFSERQEARGESMLTLMLQQALGEMSKEAAGKGNPRSQTMSLALLGAMMSPDSDYQLKLVLGRMFGEIEQQMMGLEGPDGSVIINERNDKALEVLATTVAEGKKNIGIFYGAGHFSSMEKALVKMGYTRVGQTWRVAWDIQKKANPTTQPTTR